MQYRAGRALLLGLWWLLDTTEASAPATTTMALIRHVPVPVAVGTSAGLTSGTGNAPAHPTELSSDATVQRQQVPIDHRTDVVLFAEHFLLVQRLGGELVPFRIPGARRQRIAHHRTAGGGRGHRGPRRCRGLLERNCSLLPDAVVLFGHCRSRRGHVGHTAEPQVVGGIARRGVLVPKAVGSGRAVLLVASRRAPVQVTVAGTPAARSLHLVHRLGRRTQTDVSHWDSTQTHVDEDKKKGE